MGADSAEPGSDRGGPVRPDTATTGKRTQALVLNYRGGDFLIRCIESLKRAESPRGGFGILVIDNDSDDDSIAHLRSAFPDSEVLETGRNVGYAGGNNAGIRAALGAGTDTEYVAIVNMDLEVHPLWLRELVDAADQNRDAAILGSRVLTGDGRLVEFDGRQFDPVTTSGGYSYSPASSSETTAYEAPYACGAALLLRLGMLRETGLFDPSFFAYHEDVDLALRCWLRGFRVLQVPTSIVYHAGGGSGAGSTFRDFMGGRNSLLTVAKIFDRRAWKRYGEALTRHFFPDGDPERIRASLAAFHTLPRTLRYRRHLSSRTQTPYSRVMRSLEKMTRTP